MLSTPPQVQHQADVFDENSETEYIDITRNNDKPDMPLEDWRLLYFKGVSLTFGKNTTTNGT